MKEEKKRLKESPRGRFYWEEETEEVLFAKSSLLGGPTYPLIKAEHFVEAG